MGSLSWQPSYGTIDPEHLAFLEKEQNGLDCGTLTEAAEVEGRIINGMPVEQGYPWLFNILLSRDRFDEDLKKGGFLKIFIKYHIWACIVF